MVSGVTEGLVCHCFERVETGCDFLSDVGVSVEHEMSVVTNAGNFVGVFVWDVLIADENA